MNILLILTIVLVLYLSDVVTKQIRNMLDAIDSWQDKRDMEKFKAMTDEEKDAHRYSLVYESCGDIFKDMESKRSAYEKFIRKHSWIFSIRRFFICWLEHPEDLQLWIKHCYQRITRGWSNRDAWGLDYHLSEVITGGCKWLKENKHGIPMSAFEETDPLDETGNHTDEAMEMATVRWNKILDSIIDTFEVTKNIQEDHWVYQRSSEYDMKLATKYRKMNKELKEAHPKLYEKRNLHVMTKKECIKYEEGWKNFQEHYFSLWD